MERLGLRTAAAIAGICVLLTIDCAANAAEPVATAAEEKPAAKAADVVKQPLNDLNIVHKEIAPALQRVKAAPYARPSGDCQSLNSEIRELDAALGPDFDVANGKGAPLSKKVSDTTFDVARGAVSSVIPYRGVVRQVTGAEKRARAMNEALLAGTVRRAYLKGYGEMLGCQYPAAPRSSEEAQASLEVPQ